jgi:hypothetical protein
MLQQATRIMIYSVSGTIYLYALCSGCNSCNLVRHKEAALPRIAYSVPNDWPLPQVLPMAGSAPGSRVGSSLEEVEAGEEYEVFHISPESNLAGGESMDSWSLTYHNKCELTDNVRDLEGKLEALAFRELSDSPAMSPVYLAPSLDTYVTLYHQGTFGNEFTYILSVLRTSVKADKRDYEKARRL